MFKDTKTSSLPMSRKDFLRQASFGLGQLLQETVSDSIAPVKEVLDSQNVTSKQVACIEITNCSAFKGSGCQKCYEVCPIKDSAIILVENLPQINIEQCTGCGDCLPVCPEENAIFLRAAESHFGI